MRSLLSVLLIVAVLALDEGLAQGQQPTKIPRIGVLAAGSPHPGHLRNRTALLKGLEDLGYIEGKNIIIEYRYAKGKRKLLPGLVADLIRLKVSVIIPSGPTALRPLLKATKTIPIVLVSGNPIGKPYIKSSAEPGGNVTGLSSHAEGLVAKRMEMFKETFPAMSRVVILDPPRRQRNIPDYQRAAQALGIGLEPIRVRNRKEFQSVFTKIEMMRPDALITIRNTLTYGYARQIAQFSIENRIPLFGDDSRFVVSGALMSYGVNYRANWRRAAVYVDKILKGANPAVLPLEPPQFELVINLRTARKIGVKIPPEILLEANEIIK